MPEFTPTQLRILQVLADGMRHHKTELHACLDDELARVDTVLFHIANIRKILRTIGQDIVCESLGRKCVYRQVRLLSMDAYDGK